MSTPQRLSALLAEQTHRSFVGREGELALLEGLVGPAGRPASCTSMATRASGSRRSWPPSSSGCGDREWRWSSSTAARSSRPEPGLLGALGSEDRDVGTTTARLGALGGTVLLALDHVEVFRLMDTWLRQVLAPALDEHVRVVLVGREAPVAAWFGWEGLFRSVALGPLRDEDAQLLLSRRGHRPDEARRLSRIARGHPLALTLASAAARERPDLVVEDAATTRVVTELTRMYLEDVPDPLTRRALQAASVVRRVTEPLLAAMLPDAPAQDAFERLLELPFTDFGSDGVFLHDAVREPISSFLRAIDPSRHRDYRKAAWRRLRSEVRDAGRDGREAGGRPGRRPGPRPACDRSRDGEHLRRRA